MTVPRASAAESAGVLADVVAPLVARGVIVRRPRVVGALDRLDADRRAVRRLQRLRARHGDGPVLLRGVPGREVAFVLGPDEVMRVLDESPEPFAPASWEKRAALAHFQPRGVLISSVAQRPALRRANEEVLDTAHPVHRLYEQITAKVDEEAASMAGGQLAWDDFAPAWWRLVRRVVLGDGAREDHELTDLLTRLRKDANWAFAKPRRTRLRERFFARLQAQLDRREPGSLAALGAPVDQVPQWLFAFDAAGMSAFRALALLDAHPDQLARARGEVAAGTPGLPFLRACVLEAVRLWPTTPAVLRETTTETTWAPGTLPKGATVVVFAPFLHRDDERLPYADAFSPDLWLGDGPPRAAALIPFSAGPVECPGRNLVLLVTSTLLATLVGRVRLVGALDGDGRLPATLSPFRLRFVRDAGQPALAG